MPARLHTTSLGPRSARSAPEVSAGGIQIAAASGARAKRSDFPPFFCPLSLSLSPKATAAAERPGQTTSVRNVNLRYSVFFFGKTKIIIQTTVGADETTCNKN